MTVGIYKLEFTDGTFYIGRSVSISSRYKDHISTLNRNASKCTKLQNKFNELNKQIPALTILEVCSLIDIKEKEAFWINNLNALSVGLNTLPGGDDVLLGEKHPNSKYTDKQVLEVIRLLGTEYNEGLTHKIISDLTEVSVSTIKDIITGRSHAWVKDTHPEEYNAMVSSKGVRRSNSLKNLNPFANKKTLVYPQIVSPEGVVYIVEHLTNFCNEHGLAASNLSKVFKKDRAHHKGWRLHK